MPCTVAALAARSYCTQFRSTRLQILYSYCAHSRIHARDCCLPIQDTLTVSRITSHRADPVRSRLLWTANGRPAGRATSPQCLTIRMYLVRTWHSRLYGGLFLPATGTQHSYSRTGSSTRRSHTAPRDLSPYLGSTRLWRGVGEDLQTCPILSLDELALCAFALLPQLSTVQQVASPSPTTGATESTTPRWQRGEVWATGGGVWGTPPWSSSRPPIRTNHLNN